MKPIHPSPNLCQECGMNVENYDYHPYAACLIFKASKSSEVVAENLEQVRRHGAKDMAAEITTLRNELDRAREDAERFAFMFKSERGSSKQIVHLEYRVLCGESPTLDEWREAIDAARTSVGDSPGE